MFFKKLTIKSKSFLSTSIAMGLILIALIYSLSGINSIRDRFVQFIDHDQASLDALQVMYGDGLLSGIATRNKVFNPSLKGPLKVTSAAIDRFNAAMARALELNVQKPDILSRLNSVKTSWQQNSRLKLEVIKLVDDGNHETAKKLLVTQEHKTWRPIRKELQALMQLERESFTNTRNEVIDTVQTTLMTGGIMGAAALFLGLFLVLAVISIINKGLKTTIGALDDIAEGGGDLTRRLDDSGHDELSQLSRGFNHFVNKIQSLVTEVADASIKLKSGVLLMTNLTEEAKDGASDQQLEIDQVATAMTEMTATVQEVARHANEAAAAAQQADQEAHSGKQVVELTMDTIGQLANDVEKAAEVINKLEQKSENINLVLDVIKGIAEQTNLLALNAAIEAARAGEQGRGFAVVADEVRTLASRTQQSTQEIEEMIKSLQQGSENASRVMGESQERAQVSVTQAAQAADSLQSITQSVITISDMNAHIATAAKEQSSVAEEINKNIVRISMLADKSTDGANETSKASVDIQSLSTQLEELVGRFKIN